jgi:hypothetical protein
MDRSDDAFAYFPVAIAGAVLGLGLMVGCGYFAYDHGPAGDNTRRLSSYAMIDGRVEWAGWRMSTGRGGPHRFLQIRFEGDHRGFLVASENVPRAHRRQFERTRTGDDEIPSLMGRAATVAVDSALLNEETPYISGLWVGEETIIPVRGNSCDSVDGWRQTALLSLYWMGTLVGLGILGVSVQHLTVCVRYWRSRAV